MKKRILPALLALAMVLTMLPMAVFADGDPTFTIPDTCTSTDNSAVTADGTDTNGGYITNTGEGAYKFGGQWYSVTNWLADARSILGRIGENGKSSTTGKQEDGTRYDVRNATNNLNYAIKANEFSNEDANKQALNELINTVKGEFAAKKKLDLSGEVDADGKPQGVKLVAGSPSTGENDLGILAPFTGLDELDLSGNQIGITADTGTDGALLPDEKLNDVFTDLKVLKLNNCGLKDVNILSTYTALIELDVSNNADLDNIAFVAGESTGAGEDGKPTFNDNTTLTTLKITGTKVTSLAPLVYCTRLTNLDAQDLELTDLGGLKEVAERAGKNANLTGTSVTLTEAQNNPVTLANVKAMLDKVSGSVTVKNHEGNTVNIPENGTVTVTAEHGTVVLKVDGEVVDAGAAIAVGKTVTVEVTPDAGYVKSNVTVKSGDTGVPYDTANNTFTMPAGNVALTAAMNAKPTYAVTVSKVDKDGNAITDGVTVTLDKESTYEGDTVTITVATSGDYADAQIEVTSSDATVTAVDGQDGKYTFTMPNKAVAITVKATIGQQPPAEPGCAYAATGTYGGTINLTGLESGKKYVVQLAKADAEGNKVGACAIVIFTTEGTSHSVDVLPNPNGYIVDLFKYPDSGSITSFTELTTVFGRRPAAPAPSAG